MRQASGRHGWRGRDCAAARAILHRATIGSSSVVTWRRGPRAPFHTPPNVNTSSLRVYSRDYKTWFYVNNFCCLPKYAQLYHVCQGIFSVVFSATNKSLGTTMVTNNGLAVAVVVDVLYMRVLRMFWKCIMVNKRNHINVINIYFNSTIHTTKI